MYEVIICLIIVMSIISFNVIYLSQISNEIEVNRQTYRMKQLLIANLMLLENSKELLPNQENYTFSVDEQLICIEWMDVNNNKRQYCEMYKQ